MPRITTLTGRWGTRKTLAKALALDLVEVRGVHHMLGRLFGAGSALALTRFTPSVRDTWLMVARKPAAWAPRRELADAEFRRLTGLTQVSRPGAKDTLRSSLRDDHRRTLIVTDRRRLLPRGPAWHRITPQGIALSPADQVRQFVDQTRRPPARGSGLRLLTCCRRAISTIGSWHGIGARYCSN